MLYQYVSKQIYPKLFSKNQTILVSFCLDRSFLCKTSDFQDKCLLGRWKGKDCSSSPTIRKFTLEVNSQVSVPLTNNIYAFVQARVPSLKLV